ncbi:WYL domain-containing protein [Synergistaceae bacterium OttesenSCG-928-D05]|nr:WYL domain-containing protein [Synergistaceae bacterium OttesenSCG-928-D05]
MAESSKLKLLYILEIMKKTDWLHPLNTTEIAKKLRSKYGVTAERKSIARDLACLDDAGYSIKLCEDHNRGYYMTDQLFEDYELKLLADAVNASPFLTVKDTRDLVKKIHSLATVEGEEIIKATSLCDPGIKTENVRNKMKLDILTRAIKYKRKISFQYHAVGKDAGKKLHRDGKVYTVSPYYLVMFQYEYYLIANPDTHDHLTHFRLERITNLDELKTIIRNPRELPEHGEAFDLASYMRSAVNMWTGETVSIRLHCKDFMRPHIRARFGKEAHFSEDRDGGFSVTLRVVDNRGLYQWLAHYGESVKVLSPDTVVEHYLAYLGDILKNYERK